MPRPVKWSSDLHLIRERASHSRTETWSRKDLEHLFGVGRVAAQGLMKAIGEIQSVGAAHFVDRTSLLRFLDEIIAADTVASAVRRRHEHAEPAPSPKPLRASLPADLRTIMLPDLPDAIRLEPGRLTIEADSPETMLGHLVLLAQAMSNDLERFRYTVQPLEHSTGQLDENLRQLFSNRWLPSKTD